MSIVWSGERAEIPTARRAVDLARAYAEILLDTSSIAGARPEGSPERARGCDVWVVRIDAADGRRLRIEVLVDDEGVPHVGRLLR